MESNFKYSNCILVASVRPYSCEAHLRLSALDEEWAQHIAQTHIDGGHASVAAAQQATRRLTATPGMGALLERLSIHDRPRRVQGKIMNLVYAVRVDNLVRTLPPREQTVMQASAQAPHLISITASCDPNLQLSNDVLATSLAMRLSVAQTPSSPSTGAATTTHRCPACGRDHVNSHLDGCISCKEGGTTLRTLWHDDVARVLYYTARGLNIPGKLEPPSVAADSSIRADVKLSHVSRRHGDQYVDVVTYEHTKPGTWDNESRLPGIHCDIAEQKKRKKHLEVHADKLLPPLHPPLPPEQSPTPHLHTSPHRHHH